MKSTFVVQLLGRERLERIIWPAQLTFSSTDNVSFVAMTHAIFTIIRKLCRLEGKLT